MARTTLSSVKSVGWVFVKIFGTVVGIVWMALWPWRKHIAWELRSLIWYIREDIKFRAFSKEIFLWSIVGLFLWSLTFSLIPGDFLIQDEEFSKAIRGKNVFESLRMILDEIYINYSIAMASILSTAWMLKLLYRHRDYLLFDWSIEQIEAIPGPKENKKRV